MNAARTVDGDVEAEHLGPVNYHEHLFQATPLLPDDDLDDEPASQREAVRLRDSGFATMVDATPLGLGRRPEAIARIARASSLRIVATTGAHRDEHYPHDHWIRDLSEAHLAERFIADIASGMDATAVRAGMLKLGIGYWRISTFEHRVIAAVGIAHAATSAPVMVHLEFGSAAVEVLDLLREHGVSADAVVLAHIDRNPDAVLHAELADAGAYLGYDGWARSRSWPDATLVNCMADAIGRGARDRIVIGGDVARRSRYIEYGGMPGLEYVGHRVIPALESRIGADQLTAITTTNPARLLARFSATTA